MSPGPEKTNVDLQDCADCAPSDVSTENEVSQETKQEIPLISQGGTRAWLQVLGGFLVFFNIWGFPVSFGVFESFFTLEYLSGYSSSSIAWIGTVQNFLLVITGVLGGPLYDLGYYRPCVLIGSFMWVFGMMMLSLSHDYWQIFLAQSICNGVGSGLLYVPTLALVAQGHTKTRSIAMGVVASGIALGGVVYTLVFLRLQPTIGFAWAVRVMGFVGLVCFLIGVPCLVTGAQIQPARDPETGKKQARSLVDWTAMRDLPFLTYSIAQFFGFWGYLVPLFYIPTYAVVVLGTDQSTSFYLLVATQAASLFGRLAAALAAHYAGVMAPWIFCCCVSGILSLIWLGIDNLSGFIAFCVLYGFFSGALIALPPSVFPAVCPKREVMGTRMGMSWAITSIATLTGAPIAGALINLQNADLKGSQAWAGVMLVWASVLLAVLWWMLSKRNGGKIRI